MRYLTACAALMLGLSGEVGAQPTGASPAPLTELVAQIAFYPDVLIAQVLLASTHPDEIVNAEAWLEGDRTWDPRELAQEVDGNTWSPDIKALALMRPVLDAMWHDLAWTKALGDAYTRNPAEVVGAVQVVRRAAQADGELISRSGQRVIVSGATILLEPVDPQFVYVPGRGVFDVGAYERFSWGWHSWQLSWKDGAARYQDLNQRSVSMKTELISLILATGSQAVAAVSAVLSHVRLERQSMQIAAWVLLVALLAPAVQAQQAQAQTKSEKVFRATVNAEGVQVVELVGGGYFFDPNRIIVKVNVPVELKVRKEAGIVPHDITIDAPNASVQVKESLGTDPKLIKLTFAKTGEYAFYCGKKPPFVKSHRERGMEGTFQVVE